MARAAADKVDFAALRVLKVVSEYGSISIAARRLALDQSTISHTLARLRRFFDDPLLVPGTNGMAQTERCRAIVGELGYMLDRYDRLRAPRKFHPRTARCEVVMASNHVGRVLLFGPLTTMLRQAAPGVRLRFILPKIAPFHALDAGICDIAVLPMPAQAVPHRCRFLMEVRHVCVVAADGPYAGGITRAQYLAADHVANTAYTLSSNLRDRLRIVLNLPSYADMGLMVEDTNLVATVPEPLARTLLGRIRIVPTPFDISSNLYMFWSERTHEALPLRWFRTLIGDIAAREMRGSPDAPITAEVMP